VNRDEVTLLEKLVESHERHTELLSASRGDVGVVGDDGRAESLQALGDECTDATEADDADRLFVELGTRVLAALPLTLRQSCVSSRNVTSKAEDVTDGQLGSRNDVRRRGIDDHDTGGGCRLDINVVEADTGASDDLEVRCSSDDLSVYLSGRANQNGVGTVNGFEQRRAVGSVNGTHVKVRAESLDCCWRKFFGDEYDGLGHERVLTTKS
jgi:hypothetical protein